MFRGESHFPLFLSVTRHFSQAEKTSLANPGGLTVIITWVLFRLADYTCKVLRVNGTNVLVRIIGLLITALSVEICIEGLATLGWLPLPPE
ncbi:MarC family protein [Endozoicomonas numazuensis]|uniref:UPF0056 membrane protein n=1 Tax=Endozoicomonas numazuensis TaxID=1137799 RepID=A0A081NKR1_9GAMM|nr:MarC family protein [Endozoicomonas numazuensis]KEQ19034.1 hypothetical protein GZ78_03115 [Endozoicomonas numazuensis]